MILLFLLGLAFAVSFVLKLITGHTGLALSVPLVGFATLSFMSMQRQPMDELSMLGLILLIGLFGATWGVVAAKMLKGPRKDADQQP